MYKVVVIDDEPIIIRGLSQLLPWEKYNCRIVGTAADGLEGLELIRTLRPEIVFSDIYMPKMNGLAMAAAIRSEFEDTQITILTGYRDFDLLQEALRLGVARYVLKPSNMTELEEALRVMTERLAKNEARKNGEQEAKPGSSDEGERERIGETEEAAGSFVVRNAVEFMKTNYARKLTLKEVADAVFVSQWHLSKLMGRYLNKGFLELLSEIRIERAKQLLKDPSLRVGDVAEMVGFSDLPHFSRVFKKLAGMSANEFRNQI